jgi:cytochrome c oxidase subunit 1
VSTAAASIAVAPASEPSFYAGSSRQGVLSWLLTTDHKRIGILYLSAMLTFFLVPLAIS